MQARKIEKLRQVLLLFYEGSEGHLFSEVIYHASAAAEQDQVPDLKALPIWGRNSSAAATVTAFSWLLVPGSSRHF